MNYYILASGSKGNATIIKGKNTMLLLDMGLTLKEFRNKLALFALNEKEIAATIFTHDHTDHLKAHMAIINGAQIFAPPSELLNGTKYQVVNDYVPFTVGEFKITPLPTSHDTLYSYGYVIESESKKIVYMTDTGYISNQNLALMKDADLYILEANHCPRLLLETNRPFSLIQRIMSDEGHLSNQKTAHYLVELIGPRTKEIVLAHLSEEANTPEVAVATVLEIFKKFGINETAFTLKTAAQYTPLYGAIGED